ncbi:MAG: heme ABC exporter ATP-binding protein CcmA [Cognatishimia sp.]|uniref:heme ABC exporter ATP-binding protein CcmA n=1 Tax=Cognatishimia sp. TaxID=2211648 RepID=UPI004058CD6A
MLRVTDLAVSRGGLTILEGVSFALEDGQALILRGDNGSGKTTLLRTIAGLQDPVAGQVDCDPDSIAYAAHLDGIKANLTVAENLGFWADVFQSDNLDAALEAFDLKGLLSRAANTLSAGQKRRLGLARLLLTDRPIWVLDEPTVSLDAFTVKTFGQIVQKHLDAGGAALIATHVDLGIEGETLDVMPFKAKGGSGLSSFDESFL